jgi:preprotein translocase subunit SecF
MFYLHITVILFFTLLLIYSLFHSFFNITIEGLECTAQTDPVIVSKSNANDVEELKKKMEELKGITSLVDSIDRQTNRNTEDIKRLSDEATSAGSDTLGGLNPNTKKEDLPKPKGLN